MKDGKLVAEKYWGDKGSAHTEYMMSAGKSITAFLVGIAQENGKLKTTQPVSDFLGKGWSKATQEQEKAILVEHAMKMTSGLTPQRTYSAAPDTVWRYNTDVYQDLHSLLEKAVGTSMENFSRQVLYQPMGMTHSRFRSHSWTMNAYDAGRFGLMILAGGNWNGQPIMKDKEYFNAMLNTSQDLNKSYGYLWWLNGKESFHITNFRRTSVEGPFEGPLNPYAPLDMVSANGKNGQRIFVVPSMNLVVVRIGDNPDTGASKDPAAGTVSKFDHILWEKLMAVFPDTETDSNDPQEDPKGNADPGLLQPSFVDADGNPCFDKEGTIPGWENPDIRIFSIPENVEVTDAPIKKGGSYEVRVRVHNAGPKAARNVTVTGYYSLIGITSDFKPFGSPVTISRIPSGESREARIPCKAAFGGHISVRAVVSSANDRNQENNAGQRNLYVQEAGPGQTVRFPLDIANRALMKGKRGFWKVGTVTSVDLHSRVIITPKRMNTPKNRRMVEVVIEPTNVKFPENDKVTSKKVNVKVKFGKKLSPGMVVNVIIRPSSTEGKMLQNGISCRFNLLGKRILPAAGGM